MKGFALALVASSSDSQDLYRITEVGTLNGSARSLAVAMNSSGQIAGWSVSGEGQWAWHAFLWDGTIIRDLGTLGGFQSYASAINSTGQVTGYSNTTTTSHSVRHAFLWDGSSMRDLGTLGGTNSEGTAINASGQVTGFAGLPGDSSSHAFLWNGATMKDLGTLGGTTSAGNAINAKGQVAGTARLSSGRNRAFLWDGTQMRDLGTLGGNRSFGQAINAAGQVAGTSTLPGSNGLSAFLWDGGVLRNLGTLDSSATVARVNGINASGQVAGFFQTPFVPGVGPTAYPFLWDGSTLLNLTSNNCTWPVGEARAINAAGHVIGVDLNLCGNDAFLWDGTKKQWLDDLIDPSDPSKAYVNLLEGIAINVRGQIAANGTDSRHPDGSTPQIRAFLLTPMEYQVRFVAPANNSQWSRTASIPVKIALIDRTGKRITDARAAALVAEPCKIKFSASGAEARSAVCMKYNATANEFFFNWKPGSTANTGATTLRSAATYKFSMPETITTARTRAITITQ